MQTHGCLAIEHTDRGNGRGGRNGYLDGCGQGVADAGRPVVPVMWPRVIARGALVVLRTSTLRLRRLAHARAERTSADDLTASWRAREASSLNASTVRWIR